MRWFSERGSRFVPGSTNRFNVTERDTRMTHYTTADFWKLYNALPEDVQRLADKNFELLKANPNHPSLHFRAIGNLWTARVGIHYRALGYLEGNGMYWFWIGSHAEYDAFVP